MGWGREECGYLAICYAKARRFVHFISVLANCALRERWALCHAQAQYFAHSGLTTLSGHLTPPHRTALVQGATGESHEKTQVFHDKADEPPGAGSAEGHDQIHSRTTRYGVDRPPCPPHGGRLGDFAGFGSKLGTSRRWNDT